MKEKMKKWLVVAGLAAVGVALAAGISMRLYREETVPVAAGTEKLEEAAVEPEVLPETEKPDVEPTTAPTPTPDKELVIEPEEEKEIDKAEQQIQPNPEQTEKDKPEEAPALPEGTDLSDPNTAPAYATETPAPANTGNGNQQNPAHGDTKDGMIYVDGFGWIPDEGGGGEGTVANDMYENGNKIGIMD